MVDHEWDVILIGAGQNNFALGTYLGMAGLKTVICESRLENGGRLASEEITLPGYWHNTLAYFQDNRHVSPVWKELKWDNGHHAEFVSPPVVSSLLLHDGKSISHHQSLDGTVKSIKQFSFHRLHDAARHRASRPKYVLLFRGYEEAGEECPVATVIGHHPAYQMGACYGGPFEISEYEIIGGYLQEPLRLTPSETWGERLLVPAGAEIIIEGALLPGKRMVEGPFGEVNGHLGVQGFQQSALYEVRAITRRRGAMHMSILTPEGDKPWMDLAREGAYLRRCREAVPGVQAVCASGRHALLNVIISMTKMSEGDPGRAAAAALTWDWAKNVFVFDEDIDVYNPTEILWALATRVQPHSQISIIPEIMRGSLIDPSMTDPRKTSAVIIDATRPLNRPFSPVSKCPDEALRRVKLEDYLDQELLQRIPVDRTTYWC